MTEMHPTIAKILRPFFRSEATLRTNVSGEAPVLAAGEPVSVDGADRALTLSTVWRCVQLISESVANLPLLHETLRDGAYRADADELTRLMSVEPNEWTSGFDFWRQAVQTRLLFGEAYVVPQRDFLGGIKRLVLPAPCCAGPTGLGRYMIEDPDQGLHGEYLEDEVVRVKGLTLDGRTCVSVITYAAKTMSIAATADRNTLNNFANGGATLGILSNETAVRGVGELQTEVLQNAADRLTRAMHRGDRLLALGGKWSYTPFMMTASDMQFLESRKFTVDEICRFFSVHPSFVFADSTSNYKSSEMATSSFLRDTLNPILRQIESEMTRKLFPGSVGERVRFNREEIYATDLEGRMKYVEKRIQTGTMSPNEARASLGMPRVEGGDAVLMSANLKTIDQLRQDNGEKI